MSPFFLFSPYFPGEPSLPFSPLDPVTQVTPLSPGRTKIATDEQIEQIMANFTIIAGPFKVQRLAHFC